ncbi:MAG: hypothetical protein AAF707_02950 [Pseudomonadota bacterium]
MRLEPVSGVDQRRSDACNPSEKKRVQRMDEARLPDAAELTEILLGLERLLVRLDQAGSGIAAAHVDAAVQQLRSNLITVASDMSSARDPQMLCVFPQKPSLSATSIRMTRD